MGSSMEILEDPDPRKESTIIIHSKCPLALEVPGNKLKHLLPGTSSGQ